MIAFKNKVVRRMSGSKSYILMIGWRKLYNEELLCSHPSATVVRVFKSGRNPHARNHLRG